MSDKLIKVPGVGPVKPVYIYAGAGAVVLILAVAYTRRSSGAAEEELAAPADTYVEGDPGYVQGSGDGTGTTYYPDTDGGGLTAEDLRDALDAWDSGKPVEEAPYATNLDWNYAAQGVLSDAGVDPGAAAGAIANVLAGLPVTAQQQRWFLQAVGLLGNPPKGYPAIRVQDTPAQPGKPAEAPLKAPAGLKATGVFKEHVTLDWDHTAGATGYVVFRNGQRVQSPNYSLATVWGLKPGTKYTFEVKATKGSATGPGTKTTITTKKKK